MKAELGGATIANAASLSGAVDLTSLRLAAIVMPAAWTTANLTFQASPDGVTYQDLFNDAGTEVTATALVSQYVAFRADLRSVLRGVRFLKIRSGTTGSPVTQGAARTLTLVTEARED